MPRKNKDIKHGNQSQHKHMLLWPHVGPQFMTAIFRGEFKGISNELNIRKTKYYKKKGGQTINLQKDPYFKELVKKIKIAALYVAEHWYKVVPGYKVDVVSLWLNSNEKNMNHPPHNHMNTFLSGTLFLDGDGTNYPSIKFLRPYAQPNLPIIKEYNQINSNVCKYACLKDNYVIFPSYLFHYVDTNKVNKPRVSISFDIILRGKYGEIISQGETVGQYKI